MTPPDDKPDDNPNNPELEGTIRLMRCNKHGVCFYMGESCPECEKEKNQPDESTAS